MTKTRGRRWLLFVLLAAAMLGVSFYGDAPVKAWVEEHQDPGIRMFMRGVSRCGDWPPHVALALVGIGIAYAMGSRRWIAILIAMIVACAIAGAINSTTKFVAGRSRPTVTVDAGWNGFRVGSKYNAFPSGHTAASTAFFAMLCLARPSIGFVFLPIPALIAMSRLYLNAHHFSDVVAGAIVGVLSAFIAWHFMRPRILVEAGQPLEVPHE